MWRGLLALAALVAAGAIAAAALMFLYVLPNVADHRDTVAALMSRAVGQRVTLEDVSGLWQRARPEFRLRGVRLHDEAGETTLYLPELEAEFAWRSLLFLEPRFSRIELQGLALDVRRDRSGHFYVGGIPLNPGDPHGGFSGWLLRQGRVHVGQATLTWRDALRGAPPLVFRDVDFTLSKVRREHRLLLDALPPAELARPLRVDARFRARDVDDVATWNGRISAAVAGVSFPQLAKWLALPHQPQRGWGAMHADFTLVRGTITGVEAGFDLRGIETTLGEGLPPLRLARLLGRAAWQRERGGQRLSFEDIRVAQAGGALGAPFDAGVAWGKGGHEVTARSLNLRTLQPLVPRLPIEAALRARLAELRPEGHLDVLRLRWTGAQPGLDDFVIKAHFHGLSVRAGDTRPGVRNLSGRIEGDAHAGAFEIDSRRLGLDLSAWFREPEFALDTFHARGSWNRTARGQRLTLAAMRFGNADAAGTATGQYERIPGQRGIIDLNAHLDRARGTAVYRYFPKMIGEHTVDWVKRGVVAGGSDDVRLRLRGDLARFPFADGDGVFRVDAKVRGGVIDYLPGWPRIEGIEAHLGFAGKAMEVSANAARIYGVTLAPVRIVIPDLIHRDELLHVDGEAAGPIEDFIRFANASPLGDRLHAFTAGLKGSGKMKLALGLRVPLRRGHDVSVAGRLAFLDDSLASSAWPQLENVRGDVDFTGDSLSAQNLGARFLGGPLRLDVRTAGDEVRIVTRGRATAPGIAAWLGPTWGGRLSGQAVWDGELVLAPGGERMRVRSDLVGLRSALPAPLAKAAAEPLPLRVTGQPRADGRQYEMRLGSLLGAAWHAAAAGVTRGEVRFGAAATLPTEPGLRLAGRAPSLDLSAWLELLPRGDGSALPVSAVDLGFDVFDLAGRRFEDVHFRGRTRGGVLRTQVTARGIDGVLSYRAGDDQRARVSARFRELTIPDPAPAPAGTSTDLGTNMKASDFPVLDLRVDDFRLRQRPLGRLDLVAHGTSQGLVIEKLKLAHADSVFAMNGVWRDSGAGETRGELSLEVVDAGQFLARFGYPDTLRGGRASVRGDAAWEGSPADFSFASLAGQLAFSAKGGQFLRVEPGVGKLLGVLSLQSLPRRLNFDFRDIFNKGYAFDDIEATLRVARGVVYSDDFKMRGPAAKVNMSGLADLNQESVQLRVKVIPKMSEGVAVAGALLGGPLAGVGALAAQKLLRDPLEEIISQEYLVTGPWQAPDVKRLAKTRVESESPVSEP
ncbi:MAG: YhdP family protein [Thiobacillus sp.]